VSVPLFVAQEIGRTLSDGNVWLPTVTIDASQSPDVADLARVHAVEGIGDVSTHAIREDDTVVVGVQLTSPVQAMFAVAFSYTLHAEFLERGGRCRMPLFLQRQMLKPRMRNTLCGSVSTLMETHCVKL
jgi:hypothetical protein